MDSRRRARYRLNHAIVFHEPITNDPICPICMEITDIEDMHTHHVIPKVIGGPNDKRNLLALCEFCHLVLTRDAKRGNRYQVICLGIMGAIHGYEFFRLCIDLKEDTFEYLKMRDTSSFNKLLLAFDREPEETADNFSGMILGTVLAEWFEGNPINFLDALRMAKNAFRTEVILN